MNAQLEKNIDTTQPAEQQEKGFRLRIPIAIKLALAITLLIVGGMSTLGFIILENQKSVLRQQITDTGSAMTHQFASSATEMVLSDDTLALQALVNNLVDQQLIKGAVILSDKNQIIVRHGQVPSLNILQLHINKHSSTNTFDDKDSGLQVNDHVYFTSPIQFKQLVAGHVLMIFSKQGMIQSLEESRFVILLITVLMTLIAMFLAFVMSRHLSKPIHHLVDASKAIGEGNFRYRLSERRNDEIGELACSFNQMAQGLLQKSQVEDAFSRYVSSNVARKVLENLDEVELGGKHVEASVLFADIVGFTSISEKLPPDEIANILNEYFSYISKITQHYNGHIDKFMGDCAMSVFGVPDYNSNHSFNAVACAVMIRETVHMLNEKRLNEGKIPIHFKIGVNSGVMIAGNLGSNDRMEYTVIGDPVNLASRLAGIAESDEIIVLEEFYQQEYIQARAIAEKHKIIRVRGKQDAVSTYLIKNIKPDFRDTMQNDIENIIEQAQVKS